MTSPSPVSEPATRPMSLVEGVIREVRPKQWAKNGLVFVAPGAAGVLSTRWGFFHALLAFCVFSLAAGATYIVNDLLDVEADRHHPRKRHRPIAAGVVPVPLAVALAAVFAVAAVAIGFARTSEFGLVVTIYIVLTTLYSVFLKHQPVLDVMGLSSGFILRLLGGAYAVQVAISDWFLIISCFGALFIAVCKRAAEKKEMGQAESETRRLLAEYSPEYLGYLKSVATGVVLIAYCQFAVERASEHQDVAIWTLLSIIPFVIAILRYALLVDHGKGSAPEDVLLGDRQMQLLGLAWAVLMGISVYG
jgi:decaprenyl-phosphate phosphoribosyltransferase